MRLAIEWTIYPRNPWIIRDLDSGKAVPQNKSGHFKHFATPEAAERQAAKLLKAGR